MRTIRDFYLVHIRKRFPRFEPRNDFDLLALGDGRYKGPEKEVYAWLDQELAMTIALSGNATQALEGATRMLSAKKTVTGWKPSPGDAGVFIRPIPGSPYSFRLFPGCRSRQEYCLDFVETATGLPVNSPFQFELWSIGTSSIPHACGPVRLRSLECSWGYSQKDIAPGAEKFVLKDGMTCLLKRPGHKAVRFTVPIRLADAKDTSNVDDVYLPQHIVA
ncbi:hypothetical protein K466DRAFT_506375 [Polyporus arcularius HHB13444]|uniref:Uncharacterized protein n=1 Tax=Polyporus arcularius HHB13444 TaxID=1314778 RepID=A0A5C3NZT6_9APHY|nr:hypothetical protein K466DRAFT_506375 [Polyporus arcularius HHB13444]